MISTAEAAFEADVELSPPLDLHASLRPFGRWGDDGLDRWDGSVLVRTIRLDGDAIPFAARIEGDIARPIVRVTAPAAARVNATPIVDAVRELFVPIPAELAALAQADGRVARLISAHPGIVPVLVPDPFSALIRSISAQQVNLTWAATIRRRLAERYGTRHEVAGTFVYSLHPEPLARATVEESARHATDDGQVALGHRALPRQGLRVSSNRAISRRSTTTSVIGHLTRLRGIGLWSAEWFLARTLGRPRVVAGDLGVRKAIGRMYEAGPLPPEDEVRQLTAHWGDRRPSIVQALALHDLAGAPPSA